MKLNLQINVPGPCPRVETVANPPAGRHTQQAAPPPMSPPAPQQDVRNHFF